MATNVQLQGEVIPTTRLSTGSQSSQNIELNSQGAQLTSLSLPLNSEIVRLGNSYVAGSTTDVAPVAALPTTAAQFSIWNGEPQTALGKSYVIHTCGYICSTSAGAILQQFLIAHLTTVPVATAPTVTAGLGPKSLSGRSASTSAIIGSAVTIVNNGVWHPVPGASQNFGAQTPTIGMGCCVDVNGLYVIPPGGQFSLAVMCQAAASAKNQLFVTWSEVLVALG